MAITASGFFMNTFLKVFDAAQEPVNLVGDTIKGALFTNSVTPNFSTDTAYAVAPYDAYEVTGTGYSAGGAALASKTFTESPVGSVMFDAADLYWVSATLSGVRACLFWDDTVTSPVADPVIALVDFGAAFGVTVGTFTVHWASTGIFSIDLTP